MPDLPYNRAGHNRENMVFHQLLWFGATFLSSVKGILKRAKIATQKN